MTDSCSDYGPLRDAFADGQITEEDAERLRRHLDEGCASCRRDLHERAALRRAVGRFALPAAPPHLRTRILATLDREDRRSVVRRMLPWSSVAAAGVAIAALLLFVLPAGADTPRFVRQSSDFHDRVVSGSVRPEAISDPAALRDYFRRALGVEVYAPALGCDVDGGCICTLAEKNVSVPWIVYRRGATVISLIVVPDDGGSLPASARRVRDGREYYSFRRGGNTILCCRSAKLCHVWIARMDERELLDTVLATREGRRAFSGQRLSLRGVT